MCGAAGQRTGCPILSFKRMTLEGGAISEKCAISGGPLMTPIHIAADELPEAVGSYLQHFRHIEMRSRVAWLSSGGW